MEPQADPSAVLAEANEKLRMLTPYLIAHGVPPEDIGGLYLVKAIAVMGLNKDKAALADWLRQLADEVQTIGTVNRTDLN